MVLLFGTIPARCRCLFIQLQYGVKCKSAPPPPTTGCHVSKMSLGRSVLLETQPHKSGSVWWGNKAVAGIMQ